MTRSPTTDQIRNEIDHGQAGDKVNFSDPAAAPLGTDDEAAGHPPSPQQRSRTQEAEIAFPTQPNDIGARHTASVNKPRATVVTMVLLIAGVVVATALVMLLRS